MLSPFAYIFYNDFAGVIDCLRKQKSLPCTKCLDTDHWFAISTISFAIFAVNVFSFTVILAYILCQRYRNWRNASKGQLYSRMVNGSPGWSQSVR